MAALLLGIAAPVGAQAVTDGIEAWQHSDYDKAVKIWRPLAEQGDPDAQFNLAQAYRLGRGVPTNLAAAQIWLERAAVQGHLDAQTTLGLLLFQNGDRTGAMKWLKSAADKDDPRAMLVYGTALFNGDTVTQNAVLGYAYVSRAAAKGLAPAKATLAQMEQVMSAADRKKAAALIAEQKAATKTEAPKAADAKSVRPSSKDAAAEKPAPAKGAMIEKSAPAKEMTADKSAAAKEAAADKLAPAKSTGDKLASSKKAAETAKPEQTVVDTAATPKAAQDKPRAAKPTARAGKTITVAETSPAKASGSWRIQLGAFSRRTAAETLFKKLSASAPVSGRSASYSAAGAVTRLQVGPFESKAAADAACRTLSGHGQPCFPVPAK
ncbi:SPOR domain-containing protein [Sphingomonas sp.]|uniref:SPOR domain-containing protein n=1 Tax=Sphingomonas sp. TaxID=28214 RepID=UPI0025DFD2D4|nr:SPOR domain-containing protein [Sphingomonas sp.]MBV9526895.1 SPOR domain-containing protein [Sphingomonas sp.]